MKRACTVCATPGCTTHNQARSGAGHNGTRNANRDTAAHARFARAVKKRDGHACILCGSAHDLRACHITPVHQGGTYDLNNGRTLCQQCDTRTDPYAR